MASLTEIKNWFKTGLKPTQTQFWTTWDSFWHKDTPIPQSAVENLEEALASVGSGGRFGVEDNSFATDRVVNFHSHNLAFTGVDTLSVAGTSGIEFIEDTGEGDTYDNYFYIDAQAEMEWEDFAGLSVFSPEDCEDGITNTTAGTDIVIRVKHSDDQEEDITFNGAYDEGWGCYIYKHAQLASGTTMLGYYIIGHVYPDVNLDLKNEDYTFEKRVVYINTAGNLEKGKLSAEDVFNNDSIVKINNGITLISNDGGDYGQLNFGPGYMQIGTTGTMQLEAFENFSAGGANTQIISGGTTDVTAGVNMTLQAPTINFQTTTVPTINNTYYMPVTVNGVAADATGNITAVPEGPALSLNGTWLMELGADPMFSGLVKMDATDPIYANVLYFSNKDRYGGQYNKIFEYLKAGDEILAQHTATISDWIRYRVTGTATLDYTDIDPLKWFASVPVEAINYGTGVPWDGYYATFALMIGTDIQKSLEYGNNQAILDYDEDAGEDSIILGRRNSAGGINGLQVYQANANLVGNTVWMLGDEHARIEAREITLAGGPVTVDQVASYSVDVSGTFTEHSLVDKVYVDTRARASGIKVINTTHTEITSTDLYDMVNPTDGTASVETIILWNGAAIGSIEFYEPVLTIPPHTITIVNMSTYALEAIGYEGANVFYPNGGNYEAVEEIPAHQQVSLTSAGAFWLRVGK